MYQGYISSNFIHERNHHSSQKEKYIRFPNFILISARTLCLRGNKQIILIVMDSYNHIHMQPSQDTSLVYLYKIVYIGLYIMVYKWQYCDQLFSLLYHSWLTFLFLYSQTHYIIYRVVTQILMHISNCACIRGAYWVKIILSKKLFWFST